MDGGGCLELVAKVEEELGMEQGLLSSTWDFAHQLQIIWKNVLRDHPTMQDIIQLMFSAMGEYRLGKSSTLFAEQANELGYLVLTNKKEQTTRFVTSYTQGLKTYFRNLPTLVVVKSHRYEELALEEKNTDARAVLKTLSQLWDPRNLLLAVGLGQLLE